jgi:hypothetical protein
VKEGILKEIVSLVRHLADLERTTTAGRINILGMVLSLILAISLSLAPIFETLIRLIRPNVKVGAPILELFVIFCLFTLICTMMIGYLEGSRNARVVRSPPKEYDESADGEDSAD